MSLKITKTLYVVVQGQCCAVAFFDGYHFIMYMSNVLLCRGSLCVFIHDIKASTVFASCVFTSLTTTRTMAKDECYLKCFNALISFSFFVFRHPSAL